MNAIFNSFPVIRLSNGYCLRQPQHSVDDAKAYFDYCNDYLVNKFITDECIPKSIQESLNTMYYFKNLFDTKTSVFWAIAAPSGKLIGTIGFFEFNRHHNRLEISYELDSKYWNKGIMTEALREVIRFAFEKMNVYRIQAETVTYNGASKYLLQKCGFTLEGTLKQYKFYKGNSIDIDIFGYSQQQYNSFINRDYNKIKYVNFQYSNKITPESINLRAMKNE